MPRNHKYYLLLFLNFIWFLPDIESDLNGMPDIGHSDAVTAKVNYTSRIQVNCSRYHEGSEIDYVHFTILHI